MICTPKVRTFAPQEWRTYKELRLRALVDSPDAFGKTLAEEQDRSDDEWSGRLTSSADSGWDFPLVAEVDGEQIGLAWGHINKSNPDVASLYQMWVASSHRYLGAGQMLLEAVIAWARAKNARYLDLGVTCGDSPAMRLYTRAGFESVGQPQPFRPGSKLSGQPMRLKLKSDAA
jgi:GNAT superfamily N-acetyltransferase